MVALHYEYTESRQIVHFKMVNTVHFILHVFYHSKENTTYILRNYMY